MSTTVEALVRKHLAAEVESSDPKRVKYAKSAQQNNDRYGLGGWYLDTDLGFNPVDIFRSLFRRSPRAVPLSQTKK